MTYKMRGMKFDEFEKGQIFHSPRRTVTEADVSTFAGLSGDYNPLHTDAVFMQDHMFGKRIVHGMLGMSIATGLAYQLGIFEGTTVALAGMEIRYRAPIYFGDTVQLEIKVREKDENPKPERGKVVFDCDLKNQDGKVVTRSVWTCVMSR